MPKIRYEMRFPSAHAGGAFLRAKKAQKGLAKKPREKASKNKKQLKTAKFSQKTAAQKGVPFCAAFFPVGALVILPVSLPFH